MDHAFGKLRCINSLDGAALIHRALLCLALAIRL
jgi:hypothetical protein